jgi:hypothetical protein
MLEVIEIAAIAAVGVLLTYVLTAASHHRRLKEVGNKLPGPRESFLWGNAADMQAQGGLVLFLDHLHER